MAPEPRTFESAAETENNVLLAIRHQKDAERFADQLWAQKDSIASLVKHHLGLGRDDACKVLPQNTWIQGGFNICVVVEVSSAGSTRRFIFRCPMAHKLAERQYPGTIDEKVSSEVATYIWIQENCPDIRIPNLFAFGFRDGSHVSLCKASTRQLADDPNFGFVLVHSYPGTADLPENLSQDLAVDLPCFSLPAAFELQPQPNYSFSGKRLHAPRAYWPRDWPNAFTHLGATFK